MELTVVGGGDSGLITALCVRQLNPDLEINVVDDFDEEPPRTGKATFRAILGIFHDFLEIDRRRFIEEVRPVFKASAYFKNWCGYEPFHHPFDIAEMVPHHEEPHYAERAYFLYDEVYRNEDLRSMDEEIVRQRKTPYYVENYNLKPYPHFAYQFDTHPFNSFLRTLCEERDINLVNDRVETVHRDGDCITRIEGESASFESDLFVDASGFQRVLMNEMDAEFKEFDIPLDTAYVAQLDRPISEVIPATVFETGECGWFWLIDAYEHRDMGYVFASDYIDEEDALVEFREYCDISEGEYDIGKYTFTSGYYRDIWVGNCIAIGNAAGIVEPLQAPNLTTNAQAAVALSILLAGHDCIIHDGIRDTYNNAVCSLWESIYDFIYMHYRFADGDNAFWEAMQNLEGSERTRGIIEEFDKNGLVTAITPVTSAVNPVSAENEIWSLTLFPLNSFYSIMRRMGATSKFYEEHEIEVSDTVRNAANRSFQKWEDQVERHLSFEEFYDLVLEDTPEPTA